MYLYLRYMGCLAWALTLVGAIMVIAKLAKLFKERERAGYIVSVIICLLTELTFGTAVGILFYQVANLVK